MSRLERASGSRKAEEMAVGRVRTIGQGQGGGRGRSGARGSRFPVGIIQWGCFYPEHLFIDSVVPGEELPRSTALPDRSALAAPPRKPRVFIWDFGEERKPIWKPFKADESPQQTPGKSITTPSTGTANITHLQQPTVCRQKGK